MQQMHHLDQMHLVSVWPLLEVKNQFQNQILNKKVYVSFSINWLFWSMKKKLKKKMDFLFYFEILFNQGQAFFLLDC